MRYFAYMAEQFFRDSPDGKRLFCCSGPFSRPYIVPDGETERRLFRKLLWILRSFLGLMIVGQPFLFLFLTPVIIQPVWFLTYLCLVLSIWWLVQYWALRRDLAKLERAESRMSLRAFYACAAKEHRTYSLALGLIASLLFVANGLWILSTGEYIFLGAISIAFCGVCALAWGYSLVLKVADRKSESKASNGN